MQNYINLKKNNVNNKKNILSQTDKNECFNFFQIGKIPLMIYKMVRASGGIGIRASLRN